MPGAAIGLAIDLARGGRPGPQFDFSTGALPPGATLARGSPGSCVDAAGRVATLPADVPRFDHDPVTGARLGLLVEAAATNMAARSQAFDDSAWLVFKGLAKVGTTDGVAPDGGAAMRIAFGDIGGADVAGAAALYQQLVLPAAGGSWTASCWIRAVTGGTRVRLALYPGVQPLASTGDVAVRADRWTRLRVSAIAAAANVDMSLRNDVAGDSADVLVWGAQFEAGTVATSGIATQEAPATRAADVLRLDWGRLGVADGAATMRLFLADGTVRDVGIEIVGGATTVPACPLPLVAARLA